VGDILVLAGDIMPLKELEKHKNFIDFIAANWNTCLWIPGNHEFYHTDLSIYDGPVNIKVRENVHIVNEKSIVINNVEFICATLWSKIDERNNFFVINGLNDFKAIKYNDEILSVDQFNKVHDRHKSFIKKQLSARSSAIESQIVVTHHVPTLINYPEDYLNSPINNAFASEQNELIKNQRPDFWIYGHHHRNVNSFQLHETYMLTNQLGYVEHNEHVKFKTSRILKAGSPY
jgi:predicted phosphohydrolase